VAIVVVEPLTPDIAERAAAKLREHHGTLQLPDALVLPIPPPHPTLSPDGGEG
jgi:hypothetical protein